jgi:hypothetical protein
VGNGVGIAVGSWVADGTLPTLPEKTCALASSVASTARSWAIIASTVASILGVGSAGSGVTVEQASTKIPISNARTTGSFIYSQRFHLLSLNSSSNLILVIYANN